MTQTGQPEQTVIVDLYRSYLEDLGRIGGRHENMRTFYLSVMSALSAFLAMAGRDGPFMNVRGLAFIGVAAVSLLICAAWWLHMRSYRSLYAAKRAGLQEIETHLYVKPFTAEQSNLQRAGYLHISSIDQVIPFAFGLLFLGLLLVKGG
jgi:hypothetical protein